MCCCKRKLNYLQNNSSLMYPRLIHSSLWFAFDWPTIMLPFRKTYSLQELRTRPLPEGVDPTRLEAYLSAKDFEVRSLEASDEAVAVFSPTQPENCVAPACTPVVFQILDTGLPRPWKFWNVLELEKNISLPWKILKRAKNIHSLHPKIIKRNCLFKYVWNNSTVK